MICSSQQADVSRPSQDSRGCLKKDTWRTVALKSITLVASVGRYVALFADGDPSGLGWLCWNNMDEWKAISKMVRNLAMDQKLWMVRSRSGLRGTTCVGLRGCRDGVSELTAVDEMSFGGRLKMGRWR